MMKKLAILTVVALFMAGTAQAATIGVNVGNIDASDSLASADEAGVTPQTNWNNLDDDGDLYDGSGTALTTGGNTAGNFVDSAGVAVPDFDVSITRGGESGINGTRYTADHTLLAAGFQAGGSGDSTGTFTLSNVPYATYDVIVYMGRSGKHADSVQWVSADGGSTKTYIRSADKFLEDGTDIDFVESTETTDPGSYDSTMTMANYVTMSGLSGDSTITVSNGGDAWDACVSGIQIVPEPATMALLGLGGIGLVLRRRRRA